MKILLAAINAKFIHTSLAIRDLRNMAVNHYGIPASEITLREFTINQYPEEIMEELAREEPDVLCLAAYIWNIGEILQVTEDFKLLYPHVPIVIGGPEVSYDCKDFLTAHPFVDAIIAGEGEIPFAEFCRQLLCGGDWGKVHSLVWRNLSGEIVTNPVAPPLDLSLLDFPYEKDLSDAGIRIVYYEASRGCPYSCQYCLSSAAAGVRFRPLELIYRDLQTFLDAKPRLVKFVDRTFNCRKPWTMAIWKYLCDHDNGTTQFHFELSADLLDEECVEFLSHVRKGLFQFEIGVQSTHDDTVKAIRRTAPFDKITWAVQKLRKNNNIPLHLDLIAGLPFEDYDSFHKSYDDVMALRPHQFQLGFLKLLKGSGLRRDAEKYGITYSPRAPYEVLKTEALPHRELALLKDIENMTETYYNSDSFETSLSYLMEKVPSAFSMFEALAIFYRQEGYAEGAHTRYGLYDILYRFVESHQEMFGADLGVLKELLLFDLCHHEKLKKLPECLGTMGELPSVRRRAQVVGYYERPEFLQTYLPEYQGLNAHQIYRTAHTEFFTIDPRKYMKEYQGSLPAEEKGPWMAVFDYHHRDFTGNALWKLAVDPAVTE